MGNGHDEIKAAIGAHGMWKTRLRTAIDRGSSEFSTATVAQDDHCDFGKWLAGAATEMKGSRHYTKCKDLHRQFHSAAANVLKLALGGQKEEAKRILEKGDFATISGSLTHEMMEWDKAI